MDAQIYIANLSKYVGGRIQDGWFDLLVEYSEIVNNITTNTRIIKVSSFDEKHKQQSYGSFDSAL
ncbi:hypothetical protein [Enterococcus sp. DIV0187]|uniref:hypothetical protein n=1 Tax=Enterococcus sp. DIV0187 TaxID=2774644 RepID=UPI003F1EE967